MSISVLIGRKTKSKIATLEIDVTLTENHRYESLVTQNPVENGSDITDHIQLEPVVLNLDGFITNTPIALPEDIDKYQRADDAFQSLLDIRNARTPVDLITGLTVYTNMVLRDLEIPRNRTTGETLRFSATFVQVIIVDTEQVTLPRVTQRTDGARKNTNSQAADKKDMGKQTPIKASNSAKNQVNKDFTLNQDFAEA